MKRLVVGILCTIWCVPAFAGDKTETPRKKTDAVVEVPWTELDEKATTIAKKMLEKPTVQARGPAETFACMPEQYAWLLDHPDRAVHAWRKLGAKCVTIQRRGNAKFAYVDDSGSDIVWETIHQTARMRVWYAEGKVKPSPVLPLVPVKALVILRFQEGKTAEGGVVVKHHSELAIHTDSKAAATVTKMMGNSAPKLAETGLSHLQRFFSVLSCFLDRHPDLVDTIFREPTSKSE